MQINHHCFFPVFKNIIQKEINKVADYVDDPERQIGKKVKKSVNDIIHDIEYY